MKGASEEVVRSESPMADNWAAGQARVLVLWRYFGGLALEFCVIINYRSRCLFLDPLPALYAIRWTPSSQPFLLAFSVPLH